MPKKSQQTFSKRQREHKKFEKAAQKRARREARKEPQPSPATQRDGDMPGADEQAGEA